MLVGVIATLDLAEAVSRYTFRPVLFRTRMLILTLFWLPNYRQPEVKVDYVGGILLAGALLLFTLLLSSKDLFSQNLSEPLIIGSLALLLSAALVFVEIRHRQPLLAPFIFKSRTFISANIVQFIEGGTLVIAMVTIPLMATTVMGHDTLTVAWWMLSLSISAASHCPIPMEMAFSWIWV